MAEVTGGGSDTGGSSTGGGDYNTNYDEIMKIVGSLSDPTLWDKLLCAGSTWTPKKAKSLMQRLSGQLQTAIETEIYNLSADSVEPINKAFKDFAYGYEDAKSYLMTGKTKGCTRDTLNMMIPELDRVHSEVYAQVASAFKNAGYDVKLGNIRVEWFWKGQLENAWSVKSIGSVSKTGLGGIFDNIGNSNNGTNQSLFGGGWSMWAMVLLLGGSIWAFFKSGNNNGKKTSKKAKRIKLN
ncbi:MAG: hypothetical protein RH981_18970 [Arenibacter sp.]